MPTPMAEGSKPELRPAEKAHDKGLEMEETNDCSNSAEMKSDDHHIMQEPITAFSSRPLSSSDGHFPSFRFGPSPLKKPDTPQTDRNQIGLPLNTMPMVTTERPSHTNLGSVKPNSQLSSVKSTFTQLWVLPWRLEGLYN